jgi:hypothetical protein
MLIAICHFPRPRFSLVFVAEFLFLPVVGHFHSRLFNEVEESVFQGVLQAVDFVFVIGLFLLFPN